MGGFHVTFDNAVILMHRKDTNIRFIDIDTLTALSTSKFEVLVSPKRRSPRSCQKAN